MKNYDGASPGVMIDRHGPAFFETCATLDTSSLDITDTSSEVFMRKFDSVGIIQSQVF